MSNVFFLQRFPKIYIFALANSSQEVQRNADLVEFLFSSKCMPNHLYVRLKLLNDKFSIFLPTDRMQSEIIEGHNKRITNVQKFLVFTGVVPHLGETTNSHI